MPFFPPDPEMPEPEESESVQPRWWEAPEDELPALLPISEILAVNDHVAIALLGVAVYRDGVEFRLERRLRRRDMPLKEWSALCEEFMEHTPFGGPADDAGRLRFGVLLASGERALADRAPFFGGADSMAEPDGHTLSRRGRGGGGSGSTYSSSDHLWLWPLPPDGPVELVMQWPSLGIEETRMTVDGGALAELAARARPYWS